MKKYPISEFEQETINKIISEIKEIEKEEKLSELEIAYYIYYNLGKIYSENPNYLLTDTYTQYNKKVDLYYGETLQDGNAICINMSRAFAEALSQVGIDAEIIQESGNVPLTHVDSIFRTKDGKTYFTNLIGDILRIQTGMRVRNFGKPYEILKGQMKYEERLDYLKRIKKDYGKLSDVDEKQIEDLDKKFGFNKTGIYTEDVFKMLRNEMKDKEKVEEFFGTNKTDELLEKKIDFINNIIGIANKHRNEKIGYIEGIKYYIKVSRYIFADEERKKYMSLCKGYSVENGKKVPEVILVLQKQNENKYYRYSQEEKKFIKAENVEQIKQLDIKYDVRKNNNLLTREQKDLNDIIDTFEQRLDKKKDEEELSM